MISKTKYKTYYQALLEKNSEYEGLFFVGVKTTGIFCRPTCPARKPKFENCEFFETAKEAVTASFRPCQRCKPLSYPEQLSPTVKLLIDAIEHNPEKRWKNADLRELSVDVSTAQRQFKKYFGMTFIEYARGRRMGLALKQIKEGSSVIDTQLSAGYESSSGFRDAFSKIMGAVPTKAGDNILKAVWLKTPLGPMIAVADEKALYLLEFADRRGLEREVKRLRKREKVGIIPGSTAILKQITQEIKQYFLGKSMDFKTPMHLLGTDFQKTVWKALMEIPGGQTRAYADIAKNINAPKSYRAVARANGTNQLAIIIPCHRVINSNGELGGYGGGISRKQWLLDHEKKMMNN